MEILSLSVGQPHAVAWKGGVVRTAIFKSPANRIVRIRKLNLDGDRQADLTVHGGADKAVYAYPSEHYEYWRKQLPETQLSWSNFGENLTTTGLLEENIFIGDRVRVGSAVLSLTQPRLPCYKLAVRFNRDDMIKRFLVSRRLGFYFSVAEEGEAGAGSRIEILSRDPEQVSVLDILDLYLGNTFDPGLLERVLRVEALPLRWKSELQVRANANREKHPA